MSTTKPISPGSSSGQVLKGKECEEQQLPSEYLGVSITAYQTRVILLHGENDVPDCPLVCEIFAADILHPKFDGVGIRSPPGEADYRARFDALSYFWGDPKSTQLIVCNGIDRPINDNLYQALRALRNSGSQPRYLWADALCINQDDEIEKAQQVFHMLQIYQIATKVIAWLGAADDNLYRAIDFATEGLEPRIPKEAAKFDSIYKGLCDLYTRPWFLRIWVQQEIFGARRLILQCGKTAFTWCWCLSHPYDLLEQPQLAPYFLQSSKYDKATLENIPLFSAPEVDKKTRQLTAGNVPKEVKTQLDAIHHLVRLHRDHLETFEQFSSNDAVRPDLVDTLIQTAALAAGNPRDYVYGILGMTEFPSRACSIQQWVKDRETSIFVPIDYSADMRSILCAVTWAMLMKAGLRVIAKFKFCLQHEEPSPFVDGRQLPSWVIDWRLAGQQFRYSDSSTRRFLRPDLHITIENPWDLRRLRNSYAGGGIESTIWKYLPRSPPREHAHFNHVNRQPDTPYDKLLVRGVERTDLYATGSRVFIKGLWDKTLFDLDVEVSKSDIFVYLFGFGSRDGQYASPAEAQGAHIHDGGGLWVLRPVDNNEYNLVACLHWHDIDDQIFYDHWKHIDRCNQVEASSPFRRLAKTSKVRKGPNIVEFYLGGSVWNPPSDWDRESFEEEDAAKVRTFVIV